MNWQRKRVMVTGGAGFIGSHLSESLIELGADLRIIDLPKRESRLKGTSLEDVAFSGIDVSDVGALKSTGFKPEYLFHLAAFAIPQECEIDRELAYKRNVQGTFNALDFAKRNDVEKVIFPSSAQLYGIYPKYLPIDENHPVDTANSFYNYTKKLGEENCTFFWEKQALPVLFFRLFNSFGERQAKNYFIPSVIIQALNGKKVEIWSDKPTRDFTYVKDTVNALIKGAESKYSPGPINIGYGKEIKIGDLARQIATSLDSELINKDIPVTGSMRMLCDNTRAAQLLNWKPETTFEQGLERTINWYRENKHLYLNPNLS